VLIAAVLIVAILWDDIRSVAGPRRVGPVDEAGLLGAIAAGLRAGQSIRSALAAATASESDHSLLLAGKLALAGAPLTEIAPMLEQLPVNGRRVSAAMQVVATSGGRSAAVFAGLADRATEEASRRRERRALTAQSRLSATIVAGLPVVGVLLGGFDRIATLVAAGPGGAAVAGIGLGMQATGVVLVWRMARR
jgi:tight adherence protein B